MTDRRLCPTTGKRCYLSAHDARRAMAKASNRVLVYRCPYCRALHVTSRNG